MIELIKALTVGVVGVFTQSVAVVVVICSTAGQEGNGENKKENKYLLDILPLKRKLEGYRTCPKKGKYTCNSDN